MGEWQGLAVGVAMVAGLGTAACGDEDGGGRTRAEFVAETKPVCDSLIDERNALAAQHFPSQTDMPTLAQLQAFYADFGPRFGAYSEQLAAIQPAAADRALYDRLIEHFRENAATVTKAGQDAALTRHLLETDEAELHEGDEMLSEIGMNPEC
jgi:hypothetical protein